jgi:hypothetical protein
MMIAHAIKMPTTMLEIVITSPYLHACFAASSASRTPFKGLERLADLLDEWRKS